MANLYVGNLDVTSTEGELRALFEGYGVVESVAIVVDRDTGMHRGFAFVEMTHAEEAQAALHALNGSLVAGRSITVSEARSKQNRAPELDALGKREHRRHRID